MKILKALTVLGLITGISFANVNHLSTNFVNIKQEKQINLLNFINSYVKHYNQTHKNKIGIFVTNPEVIKNTIIDKNIAQNLLNANLNTFFYVLEQTAQKKLQYKTLTIKNKTVYLITFKKGKNENIYQKTIRELNKIKRRAEKLEAINPNFNAKKFVDDINAIIIKLKTFKEISK